MKAIAKLRRDDFQTFARTTFQSTHPGEVLEEQPYLTLLCDEVQGLASQPRWLVVNLPPQHLKSFVFSICLPAWLLGRNASVKIFLVVNNEYLRREIADQIRETMSSGWYQEAFPLTRLRAERAQLFDFATTQNGGLFIVPFGHSITGRGAHCLIIDDPVDLAKIDDNQIERTNTIMATKYLSRLSRGAQSTVILVQQRVHLKDPSNYILSKYPDARHLSLPLIANADEAIGPLFRRKAGEALRPDVWTPAYTERMRELVGRARFETLYQQDPSGGVAGRISSLNFPRFKEAPHTTPDIVISVDAAKRSGARSNFTAMAVFMRANDFNYLVEVKRGRWQYGEIARTLRALSGRWRPRAILIEDAAHGTTLLQEATFRDVAVAIDPGTRSKADRLLENLPTILSGHVHVLEGAAGQEFIDEVVAFPFGHNDDQVDALTQFLSWVKDNPFQARPRTRNAVGVVQSRGVGQHGPYTPLPPNHMAGPGGRGPIGLGAIGSRGRGRF